MRWRTILIGLLPLTFIGLFFAYPLLAIFRATLSLAAVIELLQQPYIWRVIWFTGWQALLSTALTLAIGLPLAFLFARYRFPFKGALRAIATVPFVMPTVVVAAAFRALLGGNGVVNQLLETLFQLEDGPLQLDQSLSLILMAHVFYNVAVVVRLVGGFWANLNPRLTEGARLLGAAPWRAFREVTLPLLRLPLVSAALLVFLFTFTSFGVILILGGPQFSTLETEIYRQYVTFLRPDIAAVLSLLQIAFTFLLMWLYSHWQARGAVSLDFRPNQTTQRTPSRLRERLSVATLLTVATICFLAPLLALVWRSLRGPEGEITTLFYRTLSETRRGSVMFIPPLQAIRNSVVYASLTVLSAGLLGLLTATLLARAKGRGWLDAVFMLPLGASAVTLGFGYVIALRSLRTSPVLVLIAHTLVALPFVTRSLLPVLLAIRPNLREAASLLGAPPWRVWREVDLPLLARSLLVGAVFAFTVSMGEFGATSFIVRPNSGYLTLPIAIERQLSQPGVVNYGQAMALSTILMAVCCVSFVAIERFRIADVGEF